MPRSTFNLRKEKLTEAEKQELKKNIENLALLANKLLTKENTKNTSMNFPESKNAQKYAIEVERLEHPEIYYHFQNGDYGAEIKKSKGYYKVNTYGFTIDKTKLKEDTGHTNKWTVGKITGEYWNEDLQSTIENYHECIKQFFEMPNINDMKERQKDLIKSHWQKGLINLDELCE